LLRFERKVVLSSSGLMGPRFLDPSPFGEEEEEEGEEEEEEEEEQEKENEAKEEKEKKKPLRFSETSGNNDSITQPNTLNPQRMDCRYVFLCYFTIYIIICHVFERRNQN
jgi:hypothetical protein